MRIAGATLTDQNLDSFPYFLCTTLQVGWLQYEWKCNFLWQILDGASESKISRFKGNTEMKFYRLLLFAYACKFQNSLMCQTTSLSCG